MLTRSFINNVKNLFKSTVILIHIDDEEYDVWKLKYMYTFDINWKVIFEHYLKTKISKEETLHLTRKLYLYITEKLMKKQIEDNLEKCIREMMEKKCEDMAFCDLDYKILHCLCDG